MPQTHSSSYAQLDQLIHAYLNQDYQISGDTIEEVVGCYMRDHAANDRGQLLADLEKFESAHAPDLDQAFIDAYGFDFDPRLWDLTTQAFFDLLRQILAEPPRGADAA